MLLTVREALDSYPFIARRYGAATRPDESAVRAALDAARVLAAGDVTAETAAVFYAFATYRRAFAGAWRVMAAMLARGQARANGGTLTATALELDTLCSDVMFRRAGFERVRDWFAAHLV